MKLRFLILSLVVALGLAIAVQAQNLQKLEIPDEVAGELQGEPVDFELTSPESMVIELSLTSDDFDPYLELLNTQGESLGYNDDGGDGTGSVLNFLAEAGTVYIIRVRSYYDSATGSFTLVVSGKAASEISLGQPAMTDLTTKPQIFAFTGSAGDEVDFLVEAEDYDTTLALLDAYGNTLVSSDDGIGVNPFISDFVLPADGTYLLNLGAYSDEPPAAPIQVIVRPTTIQTLGFGEALTGDAQKTYVRFEAKAGTTYRLEVRAPEPANLNVEVTLRTGDSYEASAYSYDTSVLIIEFTPSTDDFYKLVISGISTNNYEAIPCTITISEVN